MQANQGLSQYSKVLSCTHAGRAQPAAMDGVQSAHNRQQTDRALTMLHKLKMPAQLQVSVTGAVEVQLQISVLCVAST